jgi:hypothetical protein
MEPISNIRLPQYLAYLIWLQSTNHDLCILAQGSGFLKKSFCSSPPCFSHSSPAITATVSGSDSSKQSMCLGMQLGCKETMQEACRADTRAVAKTGNPVEEERCTLCRDCRAIGCSTQHGFRLMTQISSARRASHEGQEARSQQG